MAVKAGKLDRRIMLQRRMMVPDSHGQMRENWSDVEPGAWAQVRWEKGTAAFDGTSSLRSSKHAVEFLIRYRADLNSADWRVKFDGEIFTIEAIAEPTRREELLLTCRVFEVTSGPGGR